MNVTIVVTMKKVTDGTIPLILDHMDDDWTNHKRDNIRFLCYNCFHNLRGILEVNNHNGEQNKLNKQEKKKKGK